MEPKEPKESKNQLQADSQASDGDCSCMFEYSAWCKMKPISVTCRIESNMQYMLRPVVAPDPECFDFF